MLQFGFVLFYWDKISAFNLGWPRTHCVEQIGLKLVTILLPQPLTYWNHKHMPPCAGTIWILSISERTWIPRQCYRKVDGRRGLPGEVLRWLGYVLKAVFCPGPSSLFFFHGLEVRDLALHTLNTMMYYLVIGPKVTGSTDHGLKSLKLLAKITFSLYALIISSMLLQ